MKKFITVALIVVVALCGIAIVKDLVIKSVVTVVATQVTGAPVHIDGFSLGVFNQSVRISGFKMYNPAGFPRGILVDLPKINVAYDAADVLKGKIHLVNAEIVLKEIGLEKNKEGKLNVDSLKVVQQQPSAKPAQQMPFEIDILKLGIGKVVLKDYSAGPEPTVSVYDVNIQKNYKNITSAEQLAALILAEPMKAAGIQGAKIYGVAMLSGVAILPVAVAATLLGNDSAQQEFSSAIDIIYEASLDVVKKMGRITKEDKAAGAITAEVQGASVVIKIRKKTDKKNEVVVSARKYLLPKPQIAGGVLYEIAQKVR